MKKPLAIIASAALALCLVGCTPADVRETQATIDEIEEVNLDAITQIEEANGKYDALSEENKQKVENYETLVAANERLADILYSEIKSEIQKATELESSFFAQYYDMNEMLKAKKKAQKAVDESNEAEYADAYTELKSEIKSFNKYINAEKKKSFSIETSKGEYPFAVSLDELWRTADCVPQPLFKLSSEYPDVWNFLESDVTDELPTFHYNVKENSCDYCFELKPVETRWIEVQTEGGELQKAFVNTEVVLTDAPDSWAGENEAYPLYESGSCYLFNSRDHGVSVAIKDLVEGKGYLVYHW